VPVSLLAPPRLPFLVLRRIDPRARAASGRLAFLDPLARRVVRSFRTATLVSLAIHATLVVVLLADLAVFTRQALAHDDVTLVAIRVRS
jgi:hypothetical protein